MTVPTPQTAPTRDEAVSTGWKLVPTKATQQMLDAFFKTMILRRPLSECWASALASAPSPAGGVDAVNWKALFEVAHGALICIASMPGNWQGYASRTADDLTTASLSPAATVPPALNPAAMNLLTAAKAAKRYLEPDLVEPGRTVFWDLVSAIKAMEGNP